MNSFKVLTKKLSDDHKKRLNWFMENKNKVTNYSILERR